MEKMDEERSRSDTRFAFLADQLKRTNRVAVEIARDLRRKTDHLLEGNHALQVGQKQTNQLLGEILKRLPPANGH